MLKMRKLLPYRFRILMDSAGFVYDKSHYVAAPITMPNRNHEFHKYSCAQTNNMSFIDDIFVFAHDLGALDV